MTILEAVYAKLSGDASITSLVNTRIYPTFAPQNAATPYVTLQRVTMARDRTVDGPSGLVRTRLQVDIYDLNDGETAVRSSVVGIAAAVRQLLDGFRGTVSGVSIVFLMVDDDRDLYDSDAALARVSMDLVIWHDE